MKQQRVSLTLPRKILEETDKLARERLEDRSTVMRELLAVGIKQYKLDEALKKYSNGRISIGKAAELAGMSLWQFIDTLREMKVPLRLRIPPPI